MATPPEKFFQKPFLRRQTLPSPATRESGRGGMGSVEGFSRKVRTIIPHA